MTSPTWDAIFVGTGITSLACAAMLVKRDPGARVLMIDKHIVVGGYASTFSRPKQSAVFDCSLHKLSGMAEGGNLIRILRELGLEEELNLVYPDDYFCAYQDGTALPLANDAEHAERQLIERFPHQAQPLTTFFTQVRTYGRNGYYQFQMLDGSFEPDIAQLRWAHRNLKHKTVREALHELFDDPYLIEILAAPGIYVGGYSEDLGYLYYLHVVYATLHRGNAYVPGSSQHLSNLLAQQVERAGGSIMLSTAVEQITTDQQGNVTGVRTAAGDFQAPQVFINTSPHYAVDHLFQADIELTATREKLVALKPARSTTTVYLITDLPPEQLGLRHSESMLFAAAPATAAELRIDADLRGYPPELSEHAFWAMSPIEVTNYHALAPAAGRVVCINVLDSIEHWPTRRTAQYRAKKQRARDVLIERLLVQVPGMRGHILHTEVATPHTYVRFTNNTAGSGYGAMVGTDLKGHVFHHGFPVQGVQFLSAWVAGPSYEAAFGYAEMKSRQWRRA
ncbi:NAD(P)/FAD-dependent oxidoreductase [Pantoea sp. Ap-967]|uniref:phytoene desaturase family protein n=1 Tax=Pantoea sp. Ap-967 TaxID=2608362 RepID=UPI00141DAD4F|nr:NAD(P)-binding protein [Pantoea sp. Ap-967]NIE75729.1 NAD(P)/FAD-dependent oxidoreductase [Pantoea sp. Ap-967]